MRWLAGAHPDGSALPQMPGPGLGCPLLTWLGSPGGTARRVLLSASPKRNSDTLQEQGSQRRGPHAAPLYPALPPQPRAHVQLKDTATVSRAFSNSLLSDSLLLS